jgi:nucleoside-diphosphate-sugar epimerase
MKILLTGAAGRLARGVRQAAAGEHELVLLDTLPAIADEGGIVGGVDHLDIVMRAAEGCDAIVHTAAMHGSSFNKASNAEFLRVNVLGAENLFQAALNHHIPRLVMASTMEVIIGRSWSAYGTAVLDETLPPRPDWIYPQSKLMIEQLGHFYAQTHGLQVVQMRFMAFDARPAEALGFEQLARWLDVTDAARAVLLGVTRPGLRDEVLHIGPDTPLTQADVNQAIADPWPVLERHWPGCTPYLKQHARAPKPEDFWPITRVDRAKLVLGWKHQVTFSGYLRSLGWVEQT